MDNKFRCVGPRAALLCQDGQWVRMACHGLGGCTGTGDGSKCDDDFAVEGDPCPMTAAQSYACRLDYAEEFQCRDGRWVPARACKGPQACSVAGNTIHCDDSMGDVGDICRAEPGDANYGCSVDKTIEVVCDGATSKFKTSNTCRGPKGCYIENDRVYCDQSMARAGERCRPVDNHSCTEDATQELKCSPQFQWAFQRSCAHGCKVKSNQVFCD
jgi:hypothetical protein